MPAPNATRRNAVLLVVMLAAQLLLMSRGGGRSRAAGWLESWILRVSSPAVRVAHAGAGNARGALTWTGDLFAALSRNVVLESELERLSADLVRYREAELENLRLRRLLGMREELAPGSVAASVVTAGLDGQTRMIVVDRGTDDGVEQDMPVVAWGGAVGRVVGVNGSHAKVRLLTDASSGVAGVVQRSRAQGMVLGRADSVLDMLYVPRFSDVMHGDRVVTSGLDGIFPRGFGIGRISAISADADGLQTIHLEPELDYSTLEEVLILIHAGPAGLDAGPEQVPE
jgi:rod shape-determining protein MreC